MGRFNKFCDHLAHRKKFDGKLIKSSLLLGGLSKLKSATFCFDAIPKTPDLGNSAFGTDCDVALL